jgi:hypothetical protein
MCVEEVVGATERQARHCFIKPGDVETWGCPFFEQPDAEVFAYPKTFERYLSSVARCNTWPSPCQTKRRSGAAEDGSG